MAPVISAHRSLGSLPGQPQLQGGGLARCRAGAPRRCPRRPGRQHQRPEGVGAATAQIVMHYPPSRFVKTICKSRF